MIQNDMIPPGLFRPQEQLVSHTHKKNPARPSRSVVLASLANCRERETGMVKGETFVESIFTPAPLTMTMSSSKRVQSRHRRPSPSSEDDAPDASESHRLQSGEGKDDER